MSDQPVQIGTLKAVCPKCGKMGKPVDTYTVKGLLAVSLAVLRPVSYAFCRNPDCAIVYYSLDGQQTFGEADLRERVYQKSPEDETVFVCYCFRHTLGDIKTDAGQGGESSIVRQITEGIQNSLCACDIRNPQGSCCLGNVRAVVQRVQSNQQG